MARVTVKRKAEKAKREKIKASIGLDGLSGTGKTGTALAIAGVLTNNDWDKVYLADAESDSSKLYIGKTLHTGATVGEFYQNSLDAETGYSPFNYDFMRKEAIELGCEVFIQDSFSHAWFREGGVLHTKSLHESGSDKRYSNSYSAWGHPDVADGKNLLFDLIRSTKVHSISTLRIKESFVLEPGDGTKSKVVSVGEKQITTEGLTYEFDLLLRLLEPGDTKKNKAPRVQVLKSRYDILERDEEYELTPELLLSIKEYLEEGTSVEEIESKMHEELVESIRNRAKENKNLMLIFKKMHPDKKVSDLTLKELRKVNSEFIQIEYN